MPDKVEHATVLLNEAVAALVTDPAGFYIDGTFGRGGHSGAILSRLSEKGRLLAIDKDPEACRAAREEFAGDERFAVIQGSFSCLSEYVSAEGMTGKVQGILLDLGVSSPQLDQPERGFSFLRDGPLDMRMDPSSGISAGEWLAQAEEKDIAWVLKTLGEERFARRMAKAVVESRRQAPITRTLQLAEIVAAANPAWEKGKHPATRAFQAIRIYINSELDDLKQALDSSLDVLAIGGRLVVISFHSLEDRMVKRFIKEHQRGKQLPRGLPVLESEIVRPLHAVGKAVKPGAEELAVNPRARSAVMRVAEKRSERAA